MSGPPATAPEEERSTVLLVVRELVVLVVTALVIAVVVKSFVAQAFFIPSGSMLPQLQIDDRVVVSKISYRLHDPRRGDIVVFDAPGGKPKDDRPLPARVVRSIVQSIGLAAPSTDEYIKRVVALPADLSDDGPSASDSARTCSDRSWSTMRLTVGWLMPVARARSERDIEPERARLSMIRRWCIRRR